jgi:hypothetical protein
MLEIRLLSLRYSRALLDGSLVGNIRGLTAARALSAGEREAAGLVEAEGARGAALWGLRSFAPAALVGIFVLDLAAIGFLAEEEENSPPPPPLIMMGVWAVL